MKAPRQLATCCFPVFLRLQRGRSKNQIVELPITEVGESWVWVRWNIGAE
jgi:hypothetical protein